MTSAGPVPLADYTPNRRPPSAHTWDYLGCSSPCTGHPHQPSIKRQRSLSITRLRPQSLSPDSALYLSLSLSLSLLTTLPPLFLIQPKSLFCRLYSLRFPRRRDPSVPPPAAFNYDPGGTFLTRAYRTPLLSCLFYPRSPASQAFPLRLPHITAPILAGDDVPILPIQRRRTPVDPSPTFPALPLN